MQERFIRYIRESGLVTPDDSLLLAVSGGIDSMVMLRLFREAGFSIAVAHCNFGLRGGESDADEQLVRGHCLVNGIACHSIKFDTNGYASENRLSVQVAARELRYAYFGELCREHGYTKVAIAHNLNDSAETLLLNLCRGTGVRGLAGIRPTNGNVVRPMLFATRTEIEEFAKSHNVRYREDASNSDVKYRRNFIRHRVMPELRQVNPSVDRAIADTAAHLQEAVWLVEEQLGRIRQAVVSAQGQEVRFAVEVLRQERSARLFMVEELAQFGFSAPMADAAMGLLAAETGRRVESATHTLLRDRGFLVLTPRQAKRTAVATIEETTELVLSPLGLRVEHLHNASSVAVEKNPGIALLDHDKLRFPLTLRVWQPGDRFVPFGMSGFKKISDFLVDSKTPMHRKNRTYVLVSGGDIAWVVGHRIDNRYRVGTHTRRVVRLSLLPGAGKEPG